jgi:hypothetical protein
LRLRIKAGTRTSCSLFKQHIIDTNETKTSINITKLSARQHHILTMTQTKTISLSILSALPSACWAWVVRPQRTPLNLALAVVSHSKPGVFFGPEEEFECPDEDECEIDWDRMPDFDEDDNSKDEHNVEATSYAATSKSDARPIIQEYTNIGDEDPNDDLQPRSYEHKVQNSIEKTRLLLEMRHQMEECEIIQEACSDFCPDCAGSGRQYCQFCRGTRTIAFGNQFRTCLICDSDGKKECSTCRGTGGVAPWVKTATQDGLSA